MKTLKNSATGASTQLVSRVGSGLRGTPAVNNHSSRYQCSTLQHTAARCSTLQHTQHTAARCNILLHTTMHCITLQPIATNCNQLQPIAINCNQLQSTSIHLLRMCARARSCMCTHALSHTHKNPEYSLQRTTTHCHTLPHAASTHAHVRTHAI